MDSKVVKSGIWYVVGELMLKGMAFISTPIFSRLLTKVEYGNVTNFMAWITILTTIATMNFHSTLIRARFDMKDKMNSYISSVLVLGNICTIILFAIIFIFNDIAQNILLMDRNQIILIFVYLLFLPAINMFQSLQRIWYHYRLSIAISLLISSSAIVGSLILVYFYQQKDNARIIGMILPELIVGGALYLYYLFKNRKIKVSYWKYALKISLPFIPHMLALNALTSMDRIMIKNICGSEDVALYSLAYSCAFIINILLNAMNSAVSPWVGEKLNNKEYSAIYSISRKYILLFVIPVLAFMLIVPEVLLIMGGKSYIEAKYVLAPLVTSCIFQFLYCMYVNIEQFEKKTVGMAIGSIITAICNFFLNLLLIPHYGYVAAAYTTMVSYFLLFLIHVLLVKRLNLLKVYDTPFAIGVALFSVVATALSCYLYQYYAIRYIVVAIIVIAILFIMVENRDKVRSFIHK